jgi:Cu(I)/Ag(I) efflux system membrane fusion protein
MTDPTPDHESFAEGEEAAPPGTRILSIVRWVILLAMFALSLVSIASYAAPHLHESAAEAAGKKYYCPMHPQITSDAPGECPICHMALEPVPEDRKKPAKPKDDPHAAHAAPAAPPGTTPITLSLDRVQAINVRTTPVELVTSSGRLRVAAIVAASDQGRAEVRVRAPGYIEALRVKQTGVKVRAGELLGSYYSPEIFQAQQELLAAVGFAAADPRSQTIAQTGRKRLELLGLGKETIERIVTQREALRAVPILAPASGHVIEKKVVLGSFVSPETPLFEIASLGEVYVIAKVFERQLAAVKVGDLARFSTSAGPGRAHEAKVDLVYPDLDPATRTARVRFSVKNDDLSLLPGQTGTAELASTAMQELAIPLDALLDTGTSQYVFVAEAGGRFSPRPVQVSEQTGDHFVVAGGLSAGERVVSGATFLIDAESRLQASLIGQGTSTKPAEQAP